jgi:hypothetical protein
MTTVNYMPTILPPYLVAIVDKYKMADYIGSASVDPGYVSRAHATISEFKLEKEENWKTYGAALDSLARQLYDTVLPTYSSFAGSFNISEQEEPLVRAAYCHLLAAKLLNAHLCP